MEAVPTNKSDGPPTNAELGRQYCDKLFAIEDTLKNLSPEERFCKRLELEKPILEAFWCWLDSLNTLKGPLWEKLSLMPGIKNHIWRTIFWMEDVPFLIMQPKMLSDLSPLEERTGSLQIVLKEQKQTVLTCMHIFNIYSCTCRIVNGNDILKIWII